MDLKYDHNHYKVKIKYFLANNYSFCLISLIFLLIKNYNMKNQNNFLLQDKLLLNFGIFLIYNFYFHINNKNYLFF